MTTTTYPTQNVAENVSPNPDTLARGYLLALQRGEQPQRPSTEQLGRWARLCDILDMVKGDGPAVERTIKTLIATRKFPGLAELLAPELEQARKNNLLNSTATVNKCPPLPEHVKANEAHAAEASPTLDAMIRFFRYWATRSYEGYHEAVAIWVLSTIAARRVYLPWRHGVWTPFYIMLVSPSTTHAKTEAAAYGQKIIQASGLGYLLAPDELTPQKLLLNMSGKTPPRNYSCMDSKQQEMLRKKLAFSGQRGWLYDEFGNKLQEIIQARGYNAVFYSLLKQLYDCKREYEYDTVGHGSAPINMPYLSIIGTATPACLKPIAERNGAVWTDGFFARISFVVPPKDEIKLQTAPNAEAIVPEEIIRALRNWHEQLGEPSCEIIDVAQQEELLNEIHGKDRGKKKDLPDFEIRRDDLPQERVSFPQEPFQAFDQYYQALALLAQENNLDERYRSTYGRLPDKALRIAMLLASLENNGRMDIRHWARAQVIAEKWRADFHELIHQLSTNETHSYGALEDAVMEVFTNKIGAGVKITAAEVRAKGSTLIREAGIPKIRTVLDEWYEQGLLAREGAKKTALYWLKPEAKDLESF